MDVLVEGLWRNICEMILDNNETKGNIDVNEEWFWREEEEIWKR